MDELASLKVDLRSLVVSSPTPVTAHRLLCDYREMVGKQLPLAKFGFRDPVAFLRERFSDCFLLEGNPSNPVLTPIVPDSLKHIDQMISRQKLSSKDRFRGKRRSIPERSGPAPQPIVNGLQYVRKITKVTTDSSDNKLTNGVSRDNDSLTNPRARVLNGTNTVCNNTNNLTKPRERVFNDTNNVTNPREKELSGTNNVTNSKETVCNNTNNLTKPRERVFNDTNNVTNPREKELSGTNNVTNSKETVCNNTNNLTKPRERVFNDTNNVTNPRDLNDINNVSATSKPKWFNEINYVTNRMQNLLNDNKISGPGVSQNDVTSSTRLHNIYHDVINEEESERRDQDETSNIQGAGDDSDYVTRDWSDSGYERSSAGAPPCAAPTLGGVGLMDRLRERLDVLLAEHPDGIWCADLMTLYKERFGSTLPYARAGCSSVIALVRRLPDLLHVSRPQPAGDWTLRLARLALPARLCRPASPRPASPRPEEAALPGVPYERGVFPEDCVQPGDAVPEPEAHAAAGDELEVAVAEVYSPSHVWLLRLGERHYGALDRLMAEMTRYYSGPGAARMLSPGAARPGHYCAGRYDGEWHRSVVVRAADSEHVLVRHVDFGTVERAAVRALRPLRAEWARLPAQAVRARLAGVRPAAGGAGWPLRAGAALLEAVRGRALRARVCGAGRDGALHVLLLDGETCLNWELVARGHADRAPQTSDAPPSFSALELGATPSWAELVRLERSGVRLECVEEYARHVPPAAPPALPLSRHDAAVFMRLARQDPALAHRHMLQVVARLLGTEPQVSPPPGFSH